MNLETLLDDFFATHSWSAATETSYRRVLTLFLEDVADTSTLTAIEFKRWLEGHESWGENMRWMAYVAVRNYLRWRHGDLHPALRYRFQRRERGKPQRTLSPEQITRLLASLPDTPIGKRNRALILLMLDTGLRASEVCRLEMRFLDLEARRLSVLAKGGKWRTCIFGEPTEEALRAWLEVREASEGTQTVFVSIGGKKPGTSLTPSGLKIIFRKLGKQAGIGLISPHDFRRTFATLAIRAGAPSRLVQLAGGWEGLDMVERYTRALTIEDFQQYLPSESIIPRKP